MTFAVWMLLAFAMWTVGVLLFSVGIYRWSRILTGRVEIREFRADNVQGDDWYPRAMRAHANCVENLPVFAVLVFALYVSQISTDTTNLLTAIIVGARMVQSIIHIAFEQTNTLALMRFLFFITQVLCFVSLAIIIAVNAL